MKTRHTLMIVILAALAAALSPTRPFLLTAQEKIEGVITTSERPAIAVPDLRGSGEAQPFMDGFNATLWSELSGSGVLKMVAKSLYPLEIPQQPADFKPPTITNPVQRGAQPRT